MPCVIQGMPRELQGIMHRGAELPRETAACLMNADMVLPQPVVSFKGLPSCQITIPFLPPKGPARTIDRGRGS